MTIDSIVRAGTRIELWLPVSASKLQPRSVASEASSVAHARGTASLVDDEKLARMSASGMSGMLGYDLAEASRPMKLCISTGELLPDVVITDHLMPGLSGTELAIELKTDL